jgi:hypothetical protein
MADVLDFEKRRRARAGLVDFCEPESTEGIVVAVERDRPRERRVGMKMPPVSDTLGWSFTPEQAQQVALDLLHEASRVLIESEDD